MAEQGNLSMVLEAFREDDTEQKGIIAREKLEHVMKHIAGPEMTDAAVALLLDELQQRFGAGPSVLRYEPAFAWVFGTGLSRIGTAEGQLERGNVNIPPGVQEEPMLDLESGERLEIFVDVALKLSAVNFEEQTDEFLEVQQALIRALQALLAVRGGVEEHFVDVFLFGDGEVSCQVYLPEFASRADADAVAKSLSGLTAAKLLEVVRGVPNLGLIPDMEGQFTVGVAERMTTSLCRRTTRKTIQLPPVEEADNEG